jgi:hypothetical protein
MVHKAGAFISHFEEKATFTEWEGPMVIQEATQKCQ